MMAYLEAANHAATVALSAVLNTLPLTLAMGAAICGLVKFTRGLNASTRHVIWWVTLVAVVGSVPLRLALNETASDVNAVAPAAAVAAVVVAPEQTQVPVQTGSITLTEAAREPSVPVSAGWLPLMLAGAALAWCAVQSLRICHSYIYLRRLKASGVKPSPELRVSFDEWVIGGRVGRNVRLLMSDQIVSPVAVGFRNPAVLLPSSLVGHLDNNDLDHMLLHELAHLARRDDWTNLIVRAGWAMVGFYPVAAFILKRIDEERELACDDWVVEMTGSAKPYALSLSRLVEFRLMRSREMLATGIGGARSQVGDRIERLLKASCQFNSRVSAARIAMTVTLLIGGIAGGLQVPGWIEFAQAATVMQASDAVAPVAPEAPAAAAPEAVQAPPAPSVPPASSRAGQPEPPPPPPPAAFASAVVEQPPPPPQPVQPRASEAAAPPPPPPAQAQRPSFLKALADAGYDDLPVEAIIELKNNGVSAEYLAAVTQAGWGRLSISDLIQIRRAGVTADYLKSAKAAGMMNISLAEIIGLRNQGVRMEAVREIHAAGFGPYDATQLVQLWQNGVRPDYFRSLRAAGFASLDPKTIIELHRHGVREGDLLEARKYGSNLTTQQIIRLKQAGVL
jgi:beta-lactamase regulating signal transducer with metallopeptidase domain